MLPLSFRFTFSVFTAFGLTSGSILVYFHVVTTKVLLVGLGSSTIRSFLDSIALSLSFNDECCMFLLFNTFSSAVCLILSYFYLNDSLLRVYFSLTGMKRALLVVFCSVS